MGREEKNGEDKRNALERRKRYSKERERERVGEIKRERRSDKERVCE